MGVLGFQKSAWSDRESLRFTVNVQVVSKQAWEEHRRRSPRAGIKPSADTCAGSIAWWSRLGTLMPIGQDYWWTLDASSDCDALADEVVDAIRTHALSRMREQEAALRTPPEL